jgi:hypothetical protein
MAEPALRPKPSLTLADLPGSIGLRRGRFRPRAGSWALALALGTLRALRILLAKSSGRQRHEDTGEQYGWESRIISSLAETKIISISECDRPVRYNRER